MTVFLQYTITDFRQFSEFKDALLTKPNWPSPYPIKEFVRGSGQIVERTSRGLNNWIGENYICKINKGIRVGKVVFSSALFRIINVSKHQYTSEGGILTKYELVFKVFNKFASINFSIIDDIINQLMNQDLRIRDINFKYVHTTIKQLPRFLKAFHIVTTTKLNAVNEDGHANCIQLCTPQIFFYLDKGERLTKRGKDIKAITGKAPFDFNLSYCLKRVNNNPYRVWIYSWNTSNRKQRIGRDFRISLLRINSEYECLTNVFNYISGPNATIVKRSVESDRLQFYLNNTISSILNEHKSINAHFFASQNIESFSELFFESRPGDFYILKNRIAKLDFRPQVRNKTVSYLEGFHYKTKDMLSTNETIVLATANIRENKAVLEILKSESQKLDKLFETDITGLLPHSSGYLSGKEGVRKAYVVRADDTGGGDAANLLRRIIEVVNPNYIFFVGCAALLDEKQPFEDNLVYVASRALDADKRELSEAQSQYELDTEKGDITIIRKINALNDVDAFVPVKVVTNRHYISGSAFSKDRNSTLRKDLVNKFPKDAVVLEMEAYSILKEINKYQAEGKVFKCLVIKGISDVGDSNAQDNKDVTQKKATHNAMQVILTLLKNI